jgi:uncharacterized membrane protein
VPTTASSSTVWVIVTCVLKVIGAGWKIVVLVEVWHVVPRLILHEMRERREILPRCHSYRGRL